MRFRVLGPLEAAGVTGPVVGPRRRAALALLLARPNQVVTSDRLAGAVWPDRTVEDPRSALHNLVSRLRAELGEELIQTHAGGYELRIADEDCDARWFERTVEQARRHADEPSTCARMLGEALSLWRGPAYQGLDEVGELHLEAARLEEVRLAASEERGEALLRAGDAGTAYAEMRQLVREQPLREGVRLLLMRSLYAGDRQADALTEYRAYRALVAEQLGLEPSVALQQLELAILRQDPSLDAATGTVGTTLSGPARLGDSFATMAIRYHTTEDGRRLAWTTVGSGPPLVVVPAWVSSLEVVALGRDPRASLLERLSRCFALTMYDRSGTGLSVGEVGDYSLPASVSELMAIVEALGGPVNLLAVSQSGPVAVTLAATRPELVSRMVLLGTFANAAGTFRPDLADALVGLVRARWGVAARTFAQLYRPNWTGEYAAHLGRVLRDSASAEVAANYLAAGYEYDADGLLASVTAPALVIHYRGDRLIPYEGGRQLAAGLPDARFLPLAGGYHLPDVADLDQVVGAIRAFLGGTSTPGSKDPDLT